MSTTDLPGSSLLAGRYRLVERLGAGGMSVVWRGFDEVLGRQVAVKVLPPSTSADPSFRRRLRAEAQAAARLSHPHITNVYDYGEATTVDGEPVPYVVMELVDGESLAAVLARARRLPWPAAVRICSEVSAALAAAHARGIVHRDVTPANVMLTPSGAKVVDFGISALIGENDIDPDGSLLGTPAYLAPERLEGGQVSPATDVYAVGLLIYRTLIGQLPWDVGTTTALLRAHQYTEPEPMPPVEGLPSAVSALIARCLEKRPSDRPSSAELAHVLGTVSAGVPSARAFVPDWADNGEDTTILPSTQSHTGEFGRVRPGQARVPDPPPARAGRGVAPVRGPGGASGPEGAPRHAAAGFGAAGVDDAGGLNAPVSPAPASAPAPSVSVAEVEAAFGAAAGGSPAAGGASAAGGAPAVAPQQRGGARNSRFGPMSASALGAGGAGAPSLPAGLVSPGGSRAEGYDPGSSSPTGYDPGSHGPAGSGPGSSGPTGYDPGSHGPAGSGPAGYGPGSSGPAGSGPGSYGSAGYGSAGSGPGSSGPAGYGSVGSGPAGHGAASSGLAGYGAAGSGPAGYGAAGFGPRGFGAAGYGAAGAGVAGSNPALRPAFGAGGASGDEDAGVFPARSAAGGGGAPPHQRRPGGSPAGGSGPGRGAGTTRHRRLFVVAGSVVALGLFALALAVAAGDRSAGPGTSGAQSATLAGSNKCVVSYAVWSDANNRFKAAITIANRDTKAISDWKLWFVMPGDQIVSGNGKISLDQQGRGVTVQSKTVLSPQQTETLQFTGRYQASNAAPMIFELGGQTCQTYVSPAPGAPSQPVEYLDNGTTRLGPVPTADNPIPGISINPSGVAVPVPVTSITPSATRTTDPTPLVSGSVRPSSSGTTPIQPEPPSSSVSASASVAPSTQPTTAEPVPPPIPPEDTDPEDLDPADS